MAFKDIIIIGILCVVAVAIFAPNDFERYKSQLELWWEDRDVSLGGSTDTTTDRVFDSLDYDQAQVFFCPEDECADALISYINQANSSIIVAIYSFTNDDIASALMNAKDRGVDVKVVFDIQQAANAASDDETLQSYGVNIRYHGAVMHNKFMVIDGKIVATGSFNYSANADENNDENLIIFRSDGLSTAYIAEFEELWSESA